MIRIGRDKVAVIPMHDPDMIGHIIVPDIAKERVDQGIIKYVGENVGPDFKIGMHVLFSGYSGTLVNIEDEGSLIILHKDFITAELPEPPTTQIPGLYFRSSHPSPNPNKAHTVHNYFPATYETALALIAEAFRDTERFRNMEVKSFAPTADDFKSGKMRG
jgi:co-chaperonin GroES (HSP10)